MERLGRKLREQRNQKRVAFSAEPDAEASASSVSTVSASGGDGSSGSSGFDAALAQDRVHAGGGGGSGSSGGGGYFGFKAKLAAVVIAGCLVGGGTYLNLRESSQHAKNLAIMSGTLASGFVFYYFFLKA